MLHRSTVIQGDCIVHDAEPSIFIIENAISIPQRGLPDHDPNWGIYNQDGFLVEAACYKRGPGRNLIGQSEVLQDPRPDVTIAGKFIYGGSFHQHFGHFLLSVLSRLWAYSRAGYPDAKIAIHTAIGIEHWFNYDFVWKIFSTLGLKQEDFLILDAAVCIEKLIVPGPSFIELSAAHKVFDKFGAHVGLMLAGDHRQIVKRSESVYLSKERLDGGVWNLVNESEMVEVLRRAGVRIVHPEILSLAEQIRIFSEHDVISGLMGSALHMSLLTGGKNTIFALGYANVIPSNFLLIDKIKENRATYWHTEGGFIHEGSTPTFQNQFRLRNPVETAEAMLKHIS